MGLTAWRTLKGAMSLRTTAARMPVGTAKTIAPAVT